MCVVIAARNNHLQVVSFGTFSSGSNKSTIPLPPCLSKLAPTSQAQGNLLRLQFNPPPPSPTYHFLLPSIPNNSPPPLSPSRPILLHIGPVLVSAIHDSCNVRLQSASFPCADRLTRGRKERKAHSSKLARETATFDNCYTRIRSLPRVPNPITLVTSFTK